MSSFWTTLLSVLLCLCISLCIPSSLPLPTALFLASSSLRLLGLSCLSPAVTIANNSSPCHSHSPPKFPARLSKNLPLSSTFPGSLSCIYKQPVSLLGTSVSWSIWLLESCCHLGWGPAQYKVTGNDCSVSWEPDRKCWKTKPFWIMWICVSKSWGENINIR